MSEHAQGGPGRSGPGRPVSSSSSQRPQPQTQPPSSPSTSSSIIPPRPPPTTPRLQPSMSSVGAATSVPNLLLPTLESLLRSPPLSSRPHLLLGSSPPSSSITSSSSSASSSSPSTTSNTLLESARKNPLLAAYLKRWNEENEEQLLDIRAVYYYNRRSCRTAFDALREFALQEKRLWKSNVIADSHRRAVLLTHGLARWKVFWAGKIKVHAMQYKAQRIHRRVSTTTALRTWREWSRMAKQQREANRTLQVRDIYPQRLVSTLQWWRQYANNARAAHVIASSVQAMSNRCRLRTAMHSLQAFAHRSKRIKAVLFRLGALRTQRAFRSWRYGFLRRFARPTRIMQRAAFARSMAATFARWRVYARTRTAAKRLAEKVDLLLVRRTLLRRAWKVWSGYVTSVALDEAMNALATQVQRRLCIARVIRQLARHAWDPQERQLRCAKRMLKQQQQQQRQQQEQQQVILHGHAHKYALGQHRTHGNANHAVPSTPPLPHPARNLFSSHHRPQHLHLGRTPFMTPSRTSSTSVATPSSPLSSVSSSISSSSSLSSSSRATSMLPSSSRAATSARVITPLITQAAVTAAVTRMHYLRVRNAVRTWKAFTTRRLQLRNASTYTESRHRITVKASLFHQWRVLARRRRRIANCSTMFTSRRRRRILSSILSEWVAEARRSVAIERALHTRYGAVVRASLRKHSLRSAFQLWLSSARRLRCLRACAAVLRVRHAFSTRLQVLSHWRALRQSIQSQRERHVKAAGLRDVTLMKSTWEAWTRYVDGMKTMKSTLTARYGMTVRTVLQHRTRNLLHEWRQVAMERRSDRIDDEKAHALYRSTALRHAVAVLKAPLPHVDVDRSRAMLARRHLDTSKARRLLRVWRQRLAEVEEENVKSLRALKHWAGNKTRAFFLGWRTHVKAVRADRARAREAIEREKDAMRSQMASCRRGQSAYPGWTSLQQSSVLAEVDRLMHERARRPVPKSAIASLVTLPLHIHIADTQQQQHQQQQQHPESLSSLSSSSSLSSTPLRKSGHKTVITCTPQRHQTPLRPLSSSSSLSNQYRPATSTLSSAENTKPQTQTAALLSSTSTSASSATLSSMSSSSTSSSSSSSSSSRAPPIRLSESIHSSARTPPRATDLGAILRPVRSVHEPQAREGGQAGGQVGGQDTLMRGEGTGQGALLVDDLRTNPSITSPSQQPPLSSSSSSSSSSSTTTSFTTSSSLLAPAAAAPGRAVSASRSRPIPRQLDMSLFAV